ncbi:hypothetical protein CVT26_010226 [Gymnopilus dilepis]|uniref:Uncharacterized protein n=1 Tax=Gymnopilus dilepis TaxID=231916 RepID=A0A409Y160_9AGAR|nr:hypothetical protein CVT26_010226 [Gymnopilus dilepis]
MADVFSYSIVPGMAYQTAFRIKEGFLLLAAQASLGVACSISAFKVPDLARYHLLIPYVDAWQVLAVAADGCITRTGQEREIRNSISFLFILMTLYTGGDGVIRRLIRSSVETAAIGALFCIMDLITFTGLLRTNFHVIFAFPMGRIYTSVRSTHHLSHELKVHD